MAQLRLVVWNEDEVEDKAARLRALGHEVNPALPQSGAIRRWLQPEPDVVVIDLDRLPSHGRELAVALQSSKSLRHIPIVFAGGAPEKVAKAREQIPHAIYAEWARIGPALVKAPRLGAPPASQKPASLSTGRSVAQKLGMRAGVTALVIDPPANFYRTAGDLPAGAAFTEDPADPYQLLICFVRASAELMALLGRFRSPGPNVWFAWPKKGAPLATDIGPNFVREAALTVGLVDYKICAIDSTWTAMLFSRRKPQAK